MEPHQEYEDLAALRRQVDIALAQRTAARTERHAADAALQDAIAAVGAVKDATAVAQHVAQQVQEHAHRRIATVVSRALAAVFEVPYEFRVVFEQKRGRTEASLVFTRDGRDIDPMSAAGGGVISVAAFALRLSSLLLQKPPSRKLLILDEPFAHLSAEYIPQIKALLQTLSEELGFQIIMVTHIRELQMGQVIELG